MHFNCPRKPRLFLERILKVYILCSMDPKEIRAMIETKLQSISVEVDGDGTHFEAVIVSPEFEGKSLLERHKLVYDALGDAMKERIHALSLKTYTPGQWESMKAGV